MNKNTIANDVTIGGAQTTLLANRYRVVRQLGQGGMGSVWLAEDAQLDGKLFAIKMLPSILVTNKRAYNQLKAEALVSMRLVHPNIVQIRAFEENNGIPFLVIDYVRGKSLDRCLVDWGSLTESEVIALLTPIARALDYAHAIGVVHRDVKPENIMVAEDGTPYLLGFGIAREIQEAMTRVTGKLASGTFLYMSPEQLNGQAPKKEQDIYSFAAMAYECLKGHPPFHRGQIEYQIMNKLPEPLVEAGVSVAPTIADNIMAGLAKDSELRPKSCVDLFEGRCFDNVPKKALVENSYLPNEEEVNLCRKSAEQGDAIAQFFLGVVMYENGIGVAKDEREAVKWYRKAAEHGNEYAKKALRIMGIK